MTEPTPEQVAFLLGIRDTVIADAWKQVPTEMLEELAPEDALAVEAGMMLGSAVTLKLLKDLGALNLEILRHG